MYLDLKERFLVLAISVILLLIAWILESDGNNVYHLFYGWGAIAVGVIWGSNVKKGSK
jgi:hypothetical protein